jgi:hypothetical protein
VTGDRLGDGSACDRDDDENEDDDTAGERRLVLLETSPEQVSRPRRGRERDGRDGFLQGGHAFALRRGSCGRARTLAQSARTRILDIN